MKIKCHRPLILSSEFLILFLKSNQCNKFDIYYSVYIAYKYSFMNHILIFREIEPCCLCYFVICSFHLIIYIRAFSKAMQLAFS